jgi:hypothetical protein
VTPVAQAFDLAEERDRVDNDAFPNANLAAPENLEG